MTWPWRRRGDEASLDAIGAKLRSLPAPEPPADLLERILATRAAGTRVTLTSGRERWRPLAVAAGIILLAGLWGVWRPDSGPHRAGPVRPDVYSELLRGTLIWPEPGAAQEAVAAPRYPLVTRLDARRVFPGVWKYAERTTTDDILTQETGISTVAIAETTYDGKPAWAITWMNVRVRTWTRDRDTVSGSPHRVVLGRDLRPIAWNAGSNTERSRFSQRFTADSVYEEIDIHGARARSFRGSAALPGPRDAPLLVGWAMQDLNLLLQALPLSRTWRGSIYAVQLVSVGARVRPFVPIDLRVIGVERVTVPAGDYDCWKVELLQGAEANPQTLWVSRGAQWLVKTEHRASDFVYETRLISHASPTPTGEPPENLSQEAPVSLTPPAP